MKLAEKFIEATKKKEANPQLREWVVDSVRKHKEEMEKEKRCKRRWWLT